ncbi:MAG: biotin/lipoyl-containing protein [Chloroflexota bacterium]|nr:biotin/lipoyl-containing protein [Chloroflexota bacterium]
MATETVMVPIPGKVIRINTSAGSQIKEGESICEIESMKMENPIVSPVIGTIVEIKVKPDQTVNTGETIAIIEY